MDVSLILKVAGVGILVAVAAQILSKSGRDEQAMLVGIAGIIVVLLMLVGQLHGGFLRQNRICGRSLYSGRQRDSELSP